MNNWETGEGDAITSVHDLEMNLVFIVALHPLGGGNELRVVPFHCDEIRVALHLVVDGLSVGPIDICLHNSVDY